MLTAENAPHYRRSQVNPPTSKGPTNVLWLYQLERRMPPMDVHAIGIPHRTRNIPPGKFVALNGNNSSGSVASLFGIKLAATPGPEGDRVFLLRQPPRPDQSSVVRVDFAFAYANAIAIPSIELMALSPLAPEYLPVLTLLQSQDDMFVVGRSESGSLLCLNIGNGEISDEPPRLASAFTSWRVVLPLPSGCATIAEFSAG